MIRLVVMKRGGQAGEVAINPERVTHVGSAPGAFTDIWFGEHHVAVEGNFRQVIARLTGQEDMAGEQTPARTWFAGR
jgi:adenine-specific DNA glycosylase